MDFSAFIASLILIEGPFEFTSISFTLRLIEHGHTVRILAIVNCNGTSNAIIRDAPFQGNKDSPNLSIQNSN